MQGLNGLCDRSALFNTILNYLGKELNSKVEMFSVDKNLFSVIIKN